MADALSIIGGFAAVIQISQVVVGYIKAVKGANVERQRLLAEINGTAALCQTLQDTAKIDVEQWIQTLRVLSREETGPLCRFKGILEDLQRKLAPGKKPKHQFIDMIHDLGWPFKQDDFRKIVLAIERQKSLFNLALTNDNLRLSMTILRTTQQMADTMEIVRMSQRVLEEHSHMVVESVESHHISHDEEMQRLQEVQAQDKKQALLSQLTTINFEAVHADISSRRAEDTGQWLLESDSLRQPESGIKLVAPANLLIGVAAVYCSYRSSYSISNLLGSVFGQFLAPVENIQSMNVSQMKDPECIKSTLQAFKEHYKKLFVVIDALDECSDASNVLKTFRDIMEIGKTNGLDFHILITGRPSVSAEIERYLRPDGHLEIMSRDEDVRKYLQQCLCFHGQLSDWIASDLDFGNLIIDSILARLSGMFLLARLYMDILNYTPTKRGIRTALRTLPLGRAGEKGSPLGIHTARPLRRQELQYALAVEEGDEEFDLEGLVDARSLTSFCAGLVIINEQSDLVSLVHPTTQEYFSERKTDLFPGAHEEIARVCIAYLRMKSLADEGALRSEEAFHQRWRSSPLLGYTAVNWGLHVRTADTEQVTKLSLLLLNEDNARLAASQALILNVIGSSDWGTEWPDQSDDWLMAGSVVFLGPLHLAAYFGLNDSAKALIQQGIDVNAVDGINGNPLHWALIKGHNDMLGSLLDRGANANLERDQVHFRRWHMTGVFTLPLSIAAFLGNVEAIEILISHGAEVNKPQSNHSDETSLSVALYAREHNAARILLDRGADVNLEPRGISEAATHRSFETLKMVIEGGTNQEGIQQALAAAASSDHDEKVAFLLQHGAHADGPPIQVGGSTDGSLPQGDTEVEDKDGRSCWEAATPLVQSIVQTWKHDKAEYSACFFQLLDAGAKVERVSSRDYFFADGIITSPSGNYWSTLPGRKTTALLTASYYGRLDMVRALIERGANINLSLGEHNTALTNALRAESFECEGEKPSEGPWTSSMQTRATLQLLVELGADTKLCTAEDQRRIDQLLEMSSEDLNSMGTLQKLVYQPQLGRDINNARGFRERREELRQAIRQGAEPNLCCARDRKRIEQFLEWSEDEINTLDREREEELASLERLEKGPL